MTAKAYVQIIRPSVCLLTVFALIVGGIVSGQISLMQIVSGQAYGTLIIIFLASLAAFLICGAGNTINDYFDYEIDKINAPYRPIPSGKIDRKNALYYYIALSVIGLVLSAIVGWQYFAIALISFAILTLYGWKWKRVFVAKNFAVAALAGISFLAGGLITGISLTTLLLTIVAISFLGTWSREIFKDIEDKEGDSKLGIKTIGTRYSEKKAKMIGYAILILALLSLLVPLIMNTIFADAKIYYTYIGFYVIVAALCLSTLAFKNPRKVQKTIKIAMYLVTLMFLVVALL